MRRLAVLILACLAPALAFAQGAVLQGGTWQGGHVPMYGSTSSQAVIQDAGAARGGISGQTPSELAITSRGIGTPPYVSQGTGPFGSTFCLYDAPIDNATGYHFVCLSANSSSAALISTGTGGTATPQALNFNVNGVSIVGVTCSGSPTSSFASVSGIVTHC